MYFSIENFNHEEVLELRKSFSENVGLILVGFSTLQT